MRRSVLILSFMTSSDASQGFNDVIVWVGRWDGSTTASADLYDSEDSFV